MQACDLCSDHAIGAGHWTFMGLAFLGSSVYARILGHAASG